MRLPEVSRLEPPKDQTPSATSHRWIKPAPLPRRRTGEALASQRTSSSLIGQSESILSQVSRSERTSGESRPKSKQLRRREQRERNCWITKGSKGKT